MTGDRDPVLMTLPPPLRHADPDAHGPPVGDVLRDETVALPGTASHVLDYGEPATE